MRAIVTSPLHPTLPAGRPQCPIAEPWPLLTAPPVGVRERLAMQNDLRLDPLCIGCEHLRLDLG